MTRANYASQRRKLEKEIVRLQKQASALEQKERVPVISGLIRTMREYDITPEEIDTAFNRKGSGRAPRKSAATKSAPPATVRTPVPPKYRNVETGATWSGRGKPPRWITEAEAEGKSRDSFLINP
ncbi:H-NS histone family protein [Alcaligenaceae bacterium]|nr:H-NS histone family protein [Alcaligenaceae bacterium]